MTAGAGQYLWLASAVGLTVLSWSRAGWLALAVSAFFVAAMRLPRRWLMIALACGLGAFGLVHKAADHPKWQTNLYAVRLAQLARFENLAEKNAGRFDLWHKAIAMTRTSPLIGHGIGSFYVTSTAFARKGDPHGSRPDFAHNALLQIAAEVGLPALLLFLAALSGVSVNAARFTWNAVVGPDRSRTLGILVAAGAYLLTQMTANSLNVYVSNQFFFWFLVAVLLASVRQDVTTPCSARPTVPNY